jgi:hypothetical protein
MHRIRHRHFGGNESIFGLSTAHDSLGIPSGTEYEDLWNKEVLKVFAYCGQGPQSPSCRGLLAHGPPGGSSPCCRWGHYFKNKSPSPELGGWPGLKYISQSQRSPEQRKCPLGRETKGLMTLRPANLGACYTTVAGPSSVQHRGREAQTVKRCRRYRRGNQISRTLVVVFVDRVGRISLSY